MGRLEAYLPRACANLMLLSWKNVKGRTRRLFFIVAGILLLYMLVIAGVKLSYQQLDKNFFKSAVNVVDAFKQKKKAEQLLVSFAPTTKTTNAIIADMEKRLQKKEKIKVYFTGFRTMHELSISISGRKSPTDVALILHNTTNVGSVKGRKTAAMNCTNRSPCPQISMHNPGQVQIIIRPVVQSETDNWRPRQMFPRDSVTCAINNIKDYTAQGVNLVLKYVVESVISVYTPYRPDIHMSTQPIGCDASWEIKDYLGVLIAALVAILVLPVTLSMAEACATEKSTMIQESLLFVGVPKTVHFLSWILCAILDSVALALVMAVLLCPPHPVARALPFSDLTVLFIFFTLYNFASISLGLWVAQFQLPAATTQKTVLFLTALQTLPTAYNIVFRQDVRRREIWIHGLFSLSTLEFGCYHIIHCEQIGEGVKWGNVFQFIYWRQKVPFTNYLLLLVYNIGIMAVLGFATAYRGSIWQALPTWIRGSDEPDDPHCDDFGHYISRGCSNIFDPAYCKNPLLRFHDVTEFYDKVPKRCCLNEVSFTLERDKTTVIVGHPGSGKSGIIRILIGRTVPRAGHVTIHGMPLEVYLKRSSRQLGVCFQGHSFFPNLTVLENVKLYARFKGIPEREALKMAMRSIKLCRLHDFIGVSAATLSNVSARLLDISIALVGNPKITVIDDPTYGLEEADITIIIPALKSLAQSRACLMTTTLMGRALRFNGQTGIMTKGYMTCFGNETYVHDFMGSGYRVCIKLTPSCNVDGLMIYTQVFVPNLILLRRSLEELIFLFPRESSTHFEFLFSNLQVREKELGVQGFQVNDITLEEIYRTLTDCQSMKIHLSQLDKLRANTEVLSISGLMDKGSVPKVVYSAVVKTASGRFSLIKSHSMDNSSRVNRSIEKLFSSPQKPPLLSVLAMLQFISSNIDLLKLSAKESVGVGVDDTDVLVESKQEENSVGTFSERDKSRQSSPGFINKSRENRLLGFFSNNKNQSAVCMSGRRVPLKPSTVSLNAKYIGRSLQNRRSNESANMNPEERVEKGIDSDQTRRNVDTLKFVLTPENKIFQSLNGVGVASDEDIGHQNMNNNALQFNSSSKWNLETCVSGRRINTKRSHRNGDLVYKTVTDSDYDRHITILNHQANVNHMVLCVLFCANGQHLLPGSCPSPSYTQYSWNQLLCGILLPVTQNRCENARVQCYHIQEDGSLIRVQELYARCQMFRLVESEGTGAQHNSVSLHFLSVTARNPTQQMCPNAAGLYTNRHKVLDQVFLFRTITLVTRECVRFASISGTTVPTDVTPTLDSSTTVPVLVMINLMPKQHRRNAHYLYFQCNVILADKHSPPEWHQHSGLFKIDFRKRNFLEPAFCHETIHAAYASSPRNRTARRNNTESKDSQTAALCTRSFLKHVIGSQSKNTVAKTDRYSHRFGYFIWSYHPAPHAKKKNQLLIKKNRGRENVTFGARRLNLPIKGFCTSSRVAVSETEGRSGTGRLFSSVFHHNRPRDALRVPIEGIEGSGILCHKRHIEIAHKDDPSTASAFLNYFGDGIILCDKSRTEIVQNTDSPTARAFVTMTTDDRVAIFDTTSLYDDESIAFQKNHDVLRNCSNNAVEDLSLKPEKGKRKSQTRKSPNQQRQQNPLKNAQTQHKNRPRKKHLLGKVPFSHWEHDLYQLSAGMDRVPGLNVKHYTGYRRLRGASLAMSRVQGLLIKEAKCTYRDRWLTLLRIMFPLCMLWFVLPEWMPRTVHGEQLPLGPDALNGTTLVLQMPDTSTITPVMYSYMRIAAWLPLEQIAMLMKAVYHELMTNYFKSERNISLTIRPLRLSRQGQHWLCLRSHSISVVTSLALTTSVAVLTSFFAYLPVKERKTGALHLQRLSGASLSLRFVSSLLWCNLLSVFQCSLIEGCLFINQSTRLFLKEVGEAGKIAFILTWHAVASFPMVYALQLLFSNPYWSVFAISILRVTISVLLIFATTQELPSLSGMFPWLYHLEFRQFLATFIPSYSLALTLYKAVLDVQDHDIGLDSQWRFHNYNHMMLVQFLVWFTVWALVDWQLFAWLRVSTRIWRHNCVKRIPLSLKTSWLCKAVGLEKSLLADDDVPVEDEFISEQGESNYIAMYNIHVAPKDRWLSKIYFTSFGMLRGDWVYILGRPSSGKTALLEVLTGINDVYKGRMLLRHQTGRFINAKVEAGMSYCPQSDALIESMTGLDTLYMYGRLRGIPGSALTQAVQVLVNVLGLREIANVSCRYCSDAAKRKLSIAIALIDHPDIIVLDEPTAGLDELESRKLWQLLKWLHETNHTIVHASSVPVDYASLSSHIAILNNGQLSSLFSQTHLWVKHGLGYTVFVTFQTDENGNVAPHLPFFNQVVQDFVDVEILLEDEFARIHFSNEKLNLAKVFALMEDGKRYYQLADYSIQQTRLHHIFHELTTASQEEQLEIAPGATSSFDYWPPRRTSSQTISGAAWVSSTWDKASFVPVDP